MTKRPAYAAGIGSVRGKDSFLLIAARVFGLCGFVVAVPLLSVLGANPTIFLAHDVDGASLVLFGLAVVLVPPAVVIAALGIVRLIAPRALPAVSVGVVGALAALAIVPIIDRTVRLSTAAFVLLLIVVGVTAGCCYARWSAVRLYTTYLAFAPILFLAVFLFASSSSVLLKGTEDVDAAALHGSNTPIVYVVFDEFPVGVLLDRNGQIDAARYPGFARLAATSTWYPNADSVSAWTHLAVPALLTGQLPDDPVPVAATHPRSLFTLFDRSHHVEASEAITHVCPKSACGGQEADEAELAHDTEVVYLHSLLPDDLAADWLPEIGSRWSGFDDDAPETLTDEGKDVTFEEFNREEFFAAKAQRDLQPGRFEAFLTSITSQANRPGLWFHHSLLPHIPYHYLPDGRQYEGSSMAAQVDFDWVHDDELISTAAQRLAIQTAMVDGLVNQLLDRLEAQGLLDRALVVVTADHGVTFEPGKGSRGASPANSDNPPPLDQWVTDDLLPVPLFVKYPGETTGTIDNRSAQTIDVLPTIVDALDVALPDGWDFDGVSLLGKPIAHRDVHFTLDSSVKQTVTVTEPPDALRMTRYIQSILAGPSGTDHDLYRLAPYGALVGQQADALVAGGATGTADIEPAGAYDAIPADGILAALFQARVTGVSDAAWLAVAVDGTIAGTGPVYSSGDVLRVNAMLDPSYLTPGRHSVAVYLIDSASSLRPLTTR